MTVEPGSLIESLERWYAEHGRHDLPWRQTRDPYAILVSEVMLQQTQVARVVPRWERWLRRWPSIARLAAATPAEVIREWSGLGYNSRAVRLREAAIAVREHHGGTMPASDAELRTLPGIGPYTAAAILCFTGAASVIPVDTNIDRVLRRSLAGSDSRAGRSGSQVGYLPREFESAGSRDRALALMDLGATVCTARNPRCDDCPVQSHCRWYANGRPAALRGTVPAQPFERTARWARGRIVALLAESPAPYGAVRSALPEFHADRVDAYLDALARDGLIECVDGIARLAGDSRD